MRAAGMAVLVMGVVLAGSRFVIPQAPNSQRTGVREEDRVDVNHAALDELLKIPGLTKSWAERIVRFRPYRTKQDLVEKGVVSGEVYSRIKGYIIAHREKQ